jgi:hypothetical protein
MIDSVPPALAISSPASTEYPHTASVQVSFMATEALSGLAVTGATLDGAAVANGQTIQLLTLALGTHIVEVFATDRAGNTSSAGVGYTVVASIDSLTGAVNSLVSSRQIDPSVGRSLLVKLQEAKQAISRGSLTAARGKLSDFKSQVSAKSGQGITPAAAQLLIADADYVLGTLR